MSRKFKLRKRGESPPPLPSRASRKFRFSKRKARPNSKKAYLWGGIPQRTLDKIQMDDVAMYSMTDLETAHLQSKAILKFSPKGSDSCILDGTACTGGNVYSFSKYFNKVIAVEIDEKRCEMLKNNMDVLEVENVESVCDDFTTIHDSLDYNILFLDPPWGGPDYKDRDVLRFHFGGMPLGQYCKKVKTEKENIDIIAIKLPVNYDVEYLKSLLDCPRSCKLHFRKQLLMVFDFVHDEEEFAKACEGAKRLLPDRIGHKRKRRDDNDSHSKRRRYDERESGDRRREGGSRRLRMDELDAELDDYWKK